MNDNKLHKDKSIYINIFYDLAFRGGWFDGNNQKMVSAPEEEIVRYLDMVREKPIYRIKVNTDNTVEVTCFELVDAFSPELKNSYETLDELPIWVQDKLAVLMLLDPNQVNNEIEDVGRRISTYIFWVFNGELDGSNPRG